MSEAQDVDLELVPTEAMIEQLLARSDVALIALRKNNTPANSRMDCRWRGDALAVLGLAGYCQSLISALLLGNLRVTGGEERPEGAQ